MSAQFDTHAERIAFDLGVALYQRQRLLDALTRIRDEALVQDRSGFGELADIAIEAIEACQS
jgi:hypothetical protein